MQFLTRILSCATALPLVAMLAWVLPALAARWRRTQWIARIGLVALWLAGSVVLLAFPHEDVFAGLDVAGYRNMARAFAAGRAFHARDCVLADTPELLRSCFYFRPSSRPTRDLAFELFPRDSKETAPFFMPALPLAAAGLSPVLSPDCFVPLMGSFWLALVLAAGFSAGGGLGLVATAALAMGSVWPAYFLRGFYAEGVGAILVSGTVAASAVRPLRGFLVPWAGLMLGLAVSYHPTLIVLSGPVALALMLERGNAKAVIALIAGFLAGVFPFWAFTRWICQPYGDWTRWETLKSVAFSLPQHRAVALALAILTVVSFLSLWGATHPRLRAWIRRKDERFTPWGWAAICLLPLVLVAVPLDIAGGALHEGAAATWSGIRWPYAVLCLAGATLLLTLGRPARERMLLAAFSWGALLFVFIKGMEVPVGLWSQRRFLPVVLAGIALLAAPLSAGVAGIPFKRWRTAAVWLVLLAGGANLTRWPAAYFALNERGATAWAETVAKRIGTNRLVVFDYFAHSVPYAADLKHRVLGLGEHGRMRWPEVADWLRTRAASQEVWVATSWSPCTLEDGMRLVPVFRATGVFPVVKTKAFLPAHRGERSVKNSFFRLVPLAAADRLVQSKVLDGSPIGLRGPWGPVRNGATWSRQGSGIVGPVPPPGETVAWDIDCKWPAPNSNWRRQILLIAPPWEGEALRLEVPEGGHQLHGLMMRPASDRLRPSTGVYSLRVEQPYDPAAFGLRGYDADLGVLIRQALIRVEPSMASVSDSRRHGQFP